ncbi:Secreted effector protein PipB2 [Halioglobus japonicus]|nr:Secreted effector protein PipB2 [Halioglobus japonicus]
MDIRDAAAAHFDGLDDILQEHANWLSSQGHSGRRANLAKADLAGCELNGCMLQRADLAGADMHGAQLAGADLRGADLTECQLDGAVLENADVSDALLIRAEFGCARLQGLRGLATAQLRDADLADVSGLTADDIAGADLTGVRLPTALAGIDRIGHLQDVAGIARPLYLFLLLVNAFIVLTVFSTPDVSIFTNAPSAVMPNLSTSIPAASLFWIAPLILIFLFAYQQFYMTQFWQSIASLPDVLPDGTRIERRASSWLFMDLIRLRGGMSALGFREVVLISLMWGAVPATLMAIWWRYLPVRDWPVTIAHIGIVLLAVWGALRLFSGAVTQLRRGRWCVPHSSRIVWLLGAAMLTISIFCHTLPWLLDNFMQSPPDADFAYPEVLGIKPKNVRWLTADIEDGDLKGTAMTRSDLRYAYGHRANLVAVNLKDSSVAGADFQRADFSRALLEDVDLSHSNLDSARFRNTCLRRASLVRSDLEDTDFTGAYLGHADLSYAYLGRSRMRYTNLQGARMVGADFEGADLRGAVFNCYVSHQHDTRREPVVQCAELSGANFTGADLTGAQFVGTDLTQVPSLSKQQLRSACGVDVQLPNRLQGTLPACGSTINTGIALGALATSAETAPEDNPCWHEMLSDFHPGPATGLR